MKALIYGNLTIDKNITESGNYTGPGGSAYFASQTLTNFHYPNIIISPYGQDFQKKFIDKLNIYPTHHTGKTTLIFHNEIKNNKRFQKIEGLKYSQNIPLAQIPDKIFSGVNLIMLCSILDNLPLENIKLLRSKVSAQCLFVFIAQGLFRKIGKDNEIILSDGHHLTKYLPLVDIISLSDEDTPDASQKASRWSRGGPLVIITKDSQGCVLFENGKEKKFPAYIPSKIIDSTGAGDIFAASFAYAKLKSKSNIYAARIGNSTASLSLSQRPIHLQFTHSDVVRQIGH